MIGQHPHDGERQPAALPSEGARNRVARTIRNMRIASARVLVAFMTMLMVFGTTPVQLWAEGAEGIAQAVTSQDAEPTGEDASVATGSGSVTAEGGNAAGDAGAIEDAGSADSASSAGEREGVPQQASQPAAEADAEVEPAALSDDSETNVVSRSGVTIDNVAIHSAEDKDLYQDAPAATKVGDTLKFCCHTMIDEFDATREEVELSDDEYAQLTYQWYIGEGTASSHAATGYSHNRALLRASWLSRKTWLASGFCAM